MQDPEIAEKASKTAYKRKTVQTSSGETIYLQGYEPFAYKMLLTTYNEQEILSKRTDVPEIWYKDDAQKKHRYYVDFYIPKDNLMVEVKSVRTYKKGIESTKITKTTQACRDAGYKYEIWILDAKGNLIEKK